ncbi:hypothetical protein HPB50_022999 [Hyalomma asiaticum]|uniref:Uncharacterized protein n=1 Tax=Hyalomma asiaticum TaxID=266040 RepID=A0ACB7T4X3_HYAAI|nr:hypothetical protein HPB50_022999 [Hyalomma asiaticum]
MELWSSVTEQQLSKAHCNDCRMAEAVLQNILLSRGLDPVPFSVPQRNLLGSFAKVKVVNGTLQGLSRLRQSGDIAARIDDCGVRVFADVTISNLTIILNVTVTTFMGDAMAIVRINISARVVFNIVE